MSAAERKEETFTAPGATHTKLTDDRALSLRPQRPLSLCVFLFTHISLCDAVSVFIYSLVRSWKLCDILSPPALVCHMAVCVSCLGFYA